jgi:type II secretory pathway pseudopilin PulG
MRRAGHSLPELVLVLVLLGLTSLIGARVLGGWQDRLATRGAVTDAARLVARARRDAVAQHALVWLRVDSAAGELSLTARGEPFARLALGYQHGVTLSATRDSVAFDVRGLGYGAANLTLVARRGAAADTLVMSRLGRVRYTR